MELESWRAVASLFEMRGHLRTALLFGMLLNFVSAQERVPSFTPPSAEEVASLLDFAGPVSLSVRIHDKESLARRPKDGISHAAYSYSDRARTSVSITIAVYPAGEFRKKIRAELIEWVTKHAAPRREGIPSIGVFRASDGRALYQFPLGFGPGGSADGALLPCRDPRYEVVIFQATDFHDDDPTDHSHHVSPRKELREVIEAVEAILLKSSK
jgi:hypothetical protein